MSPSLLINLLSRGASIAVLILVAALLLSQYRRSSSAVLGASFSIGMAVTLVNTIPMIVGLAAWWRVPMIAIASSNMVLFWLFCLSLFDDDFQFRPLHGWTYISFAGLGALNCSAWVQTAPYLAHLIYLTLNLLPLVFGLLAMHRIVLTWRDDLMDRRRRLRLIVISVIALYAIASTLALFGTGVRDVELFSDTPHAVAVMLITLTLAWQWLKTPVSDATALFSTVRVTHPYERSEQLRSTPDGMTAVANAEAATNPSTLEGDVTRILEYLASARPYREEGMQLAALAERLAMPAYRLRRAINEGMQFRNFSSFLNHYRLVEVKQALSDPARDQLPILTLALEAGFQSIGPFNRAFKLDTGMTPSEFRQASRRQHLAIPE